jgi:hypothetical protein
MIKSGTGGNQWNLKSGGSNSLTVTAGNTYNWQLNDIPDRAPSGPLAYYLTALLLTITGTITQSGSTGVQIPRDVLPALLINSINWQNSWMGPVLNFQYAKGFTLPIMEFVAGGFQYGQRQQNNIAAANGATTFSMTLRVPALNDNRGRLLKETSQLAALFQPSQFSVTMASTTGLTTFSPGASFSSMTMSVTAQLDPRQELVLGTPMEWILHTPISGGPQVTIEGFGRQAGVNGVAIKGGVAFLADLTATPTTQPGVVLPSSLTDFSFPWRGQATTYDIKAWLQQHLALLPNDRPQQSAGTNLGTSDRTNDFSGFPYTVNNVDATGPSVDLVNLKFFPLVMGGDELELSDLQTAESDQTFNMTQTGGFTTPGNHQILAEYARVWTPEKMGDWVAQIVRGGANSLATCVLQKPSVVAEVLKRVTDPNGRGLQLRYPTAKHVTTVDQETYLPHQFI